MPNVAAQGKIIECPQGSNLRRVLLKHGVGLYNDQANVINCHGIGTCGTCAVHVDGEISEPNWRDKTRRLPQRGTAAHRFLPILSRKIAALLVKLKFWEMSTLPNLMGFGGREIK